jgi:hypothetical protein
VLPGALLDVDPDVAPATLSRGWPRASGGCPDALITSPSLFGVAVGEASVLCQGKTPSTARIDNTRIAQMSAIRSAPARVSEL